MNLGTGGSEGRAVSGATAADTDGLALGWQPGQRIPKAMTIAGSDSGGGAGIQADLKAFAARGVYGTSAVTALTAQNTLGVQGVFPVTPEFVAQQIDSIMADIGADAWKTGMLANPAIIEAIAQRARQYGVQRLVVDPVMIAKGGSPLLDVSARTSLIEELLPLAYLVTPNLPEAEVLTGMTIDDLVGMQEAARAIHALGPRNVLIKGGHLPADSDAIDYLFDGGQFHSYSAPRTNTANTHGTGCTFAAAITAELAWQQPLPQAVAAAKNYLSQAIVSGAQHQIGAGHGPVDHFHELRRS